ncbi:Paraplegin [Geodia barretti]|uniref:Paraplegin n=3 Tax=Geodia barretti TaxID=519541 RepID=A0AA35SSA9_GEOBA|nr:Paraplegin [Geodia barretti]
MAVIPLYLARRGAAYGLSPLVAIGRRQSVLATSSYNPLTFPKPSNFLSPRQFWLSLPHYSQHTQLTAALGWRWAHNDSNYRRRHPLPFPEEERGGEGGRGSRDPHQWSWLPLYTAVAVLAYLLTSSVEPVPEISFPFFLQHMLYAGEVHHLVVNSQRDRVFVHLHSGAVVNGWEVRRYGPQFMFTVSGVDSLEARLRAAQEELGVPPSNWVPVMYKAQSDTFALVLAALSTLLILRIVFHFLFPRGSGSAGQSGSGVSINPFAYMSRARTTVVQEPGQGSVRFTDVAGMTEAKAEVMEFVDFLRHPLKYSDLGAKIPRGALLYGPPGTGKTLLARAVATEAGVPFISIAGSDFVEMFAGVGSARVRDLFRQARESAPCMVYIDELDAVGRSRKGGAAEGHHEQESTLNQLLVEMDGIDSVQRVVILASTNRVDILDQALLRPGRFDRQIAIDLPTLPERKAIFDVYLRKVLLEGPVVSYSARLAALTPGHSGADIANIVNEAALHAAREKGAAVTQRDFEYAVERVVAGMEKKTGVLSPEERKVVAYHEAGHALLGWLLEHTDPVLKVSIAPRTKGVLGFAQHLPSEQRLFSKEQLFDRMCVLLGGRMAEAISFRKISTGAGDDLQKVTRLAYGQVAEAGMSDIVGHVSLSSNTAGRRPYSKWLAAQVDREV